MDVYIIKGFQGIPQNCIINIVFFLCMVLIFLILRQKAAGYGLWGIRYGRKDIVFDDDSNETSSYGILTHVDNLKAADLPSSLNHMAEVNYGDLSLKTACTELHIRTYGSFIRNCFRNNDLKTYAGDDAVLYQTFQRHLICFAVFVGLVCVIVVIPVNLSGSLLSGTFDKATISNLSLKSKLLWTHVAVVIAFFIFGMGMVYNFEKRLSTKGKKRFSDTLLVSGIPKKYCFKNLLLDHFSEAYPSVFVKDIQFVFDVRKLMTLSNAIRRMESGLRHSELLHERQAVRPTLVPMTCGNFCAICAKCGCINEVDSIDYYRHELDRLNVRYQLEKIATFERKVGVCFITFDTKLDAARIRKDYRRSCQKAKHPSMSTLSVALKSNNWKVSFAAHAQDVLWWNMSMDNRVWWLRAILINTLCFMLIFFLSTPAYFINIYNTLNIKNTVSKLSPFLGHYAQTLCLSALSVILPFIVYYSDRIIGHWSKSKEDKAIFVKTYTFLIFMVLILPSLGLTSVPALLNWLFSVSNDTVTNNSTMTNDVFDHIKQRWGCIFVAQNAVFFINYVITCSFFSTSWELLRIPDLLFFLLLYMMARSAHEKEYVKKKSVIPFQFGFSYTYMLTLFSITIAYCVVTPIIAPCGLIYLVMKYAVDRHNLIFAYAPSRVDDSVHRIALTLTTISLLFPQIILQCYLFLKLPSTSPLCLVSLFALMVSVSVVISRFVLKFIDDMNDFYLEATDAEERRNHYRIEMTNGGRIS